MDNDEERATLQQEDKELREQVKLQQELNQKCKSQDSVGRFNIPIRANVMPLDPQNCTEISCRILGFTPKELAEHIEAICTPFALPFSA